MSNSVQIYTNSYNVTDTSDSIFIDATFTATGDFGTFDTSAEFSIYTGYFTAGDDFLPTNEDQANGIEGEGSLCDKVTYDLDTFISVTLSDDFYQNADIAFMQLSGPPGATFRGTDVDFPDKDAGSFYYTFRATISQDVQFGATTITLTDEADISRWLVIPFDPGPDKAIVVCEGQSLTLEDLYNAFDIVDGTDDPDFNPNDYWTPSTYQGPGEYVFDAGDFLPQCGAKPGTVTVTETTECDNELNLKLFLEGAYNSNTGIMNDELRIAGVLETTSPYADDLTCNQSVFAITGNNAIVDWVWVEIRDSEDLLTVIKSTSALLQSDGDIVEVDGVTPLTINISNGNYNIMLSHRNHLGILSLNVITFDGTSKSIDFTASSALVVGTSNAISNLGNGNFGLFSGDYNGDGQIQNTDKTTVEQQRGLSGYNNADMNLNGEVQNTDLNNLLIPNLGKGEQFTRMMMMLHAKRNKTIKNNNN